MINFCQKSYDKPSFYWSFDQQNAEAFLVHFTFLLLHIMHHVHCSRWSLVDILEQTFTTDNNQVIDTKHLTWQLLSCIQLQTWCISFIHRDRQWQKHSQGPQPMSETVRWWILWEFHDTVIQSRSDDHRTSIFHSVDSPGRHNTQRGTDISTACIANAQNVQVNTVL